MIKELEVLDTHILESQRGAGESRSSRASGVGSASIGPL
jgi:hypothetical protein